VTGAFTLPFTAYFALLSGRVIRCRLKEQVLLGDDSHKAPTHGPTPLLVATRTHANFVEYVPYAILLSAIAEMNGANRRVLKMTLAALLSFRIMHAEFGMLRPGHTGVGRSIGFFGTMGVLGFLSGYSAYLVRGYWGF
jgi:uncharacterized membrane protein YecN with MAPEG domain